MRGGNERILLGATIFWIVGMPTFLIPATAATQSVPVLKAGRAAFFVVAGLLAVSLVRGRRRRLDRLDVLLLGYLALALASWASTVAGKDLAALKADADFLINCFGMPIVAYFAARRIEWTGSRTGATLWAIVLGAGGCLALIGLVQTFHDWSFLVPADLDAHLDRAKGTFRNGAVYGVTMTLLLPVALLVHLRSAARSAPRLLSVALLAAMIGCVFGSKTRIVWLGASIVLGFVAVRLPALRAPSGLLVAGLLLQIFVVPYLVVDQFGVGERLAQAKPVYDRVALLATSLNMIRDRPLLGYGVGIETFRQHKVGYYASFGDVPTSRAVFPGHPHNELLNVTVLMGVVGLAVYVALLAVIWGALESAVQRGRREGSDGGALAVTAQAAFLTLLVAGQLHDVMYMSYPQVLAYFLFGMAVAGPIPVDASGAR